MHADRALVEARLDRFVRDHLEPAIYRQDQPVSIGAWQVPGEPVPFAAARDQSYDEVPVGWRWGRAWSTVWLHITGQVPADWADDGRLVTELLVDFGYNKSRSGFQAEGLAFTPEGAPIKAISPLNAYLPVPADGRIDVYIEAAANPDVAGDWHFSPSPYGDLATVPDEALYVLDEVRLARRDTEVWEAMQDVWTLRGLMNELPDSSSRKHLILRGLEDMMDLVDADDVAGTIVQARVPLARLLAQPASASAHRVLATGHAHIDSAWLWPLRETVRKCARTFTNVMGLMDENPDFVFACSSAQQYQWMKDFYPAVFERIKEKVAAGQFVPVGGMWVESDTNMPGSEALARQFIAGKRFFLEEFGVECEEAWLPDSFGYSGALPQIVALAGERWFLTQKISWNQVNKMPHHTFQWEGIDGTRVFTHFPPADTYIAEISADELARGERHFSEKGRASWSLLPFGWGDGGGGPTREMIAAARRTENLEGSPRVTMGSPRTFFQNAQDEYPEPPVWTGEMYLELHRGVFTSQLRTKQGNRRNEALLRQAELWSATAAVRSGFAYPYDALEQAWRSVLLLQFHDILPGSSIAWVHQDAERIHGEVTATLQGIVNAALAALDAADDGSGRVLNGSPFARAGVPAHSVGTPHELAPVDAVSADGATVLDNGVVRVEVDPEGRITSLIAAADGREAIPAGEPANVLRIHPDLPNLWDAWDLDAHYKHTVRELVEVESRVVEGDGDSWGVTTVRRVGASMIRQTVSLAAGACAVDIETRVDWHEKDKILKLAFPCDVRADRVAAETQFGHVFRSAHTNTSWDAARFEACQHRFVHLAEAGYGVAVANDSSYGYDVDRYTRADGGTTTTVRMSLLRAPAFPDPHTDQGEHVMRFSVMPGAEIRDAVELGYALANPLRPAGAPVASLVTSSDDGVVVETVKLAEDRSGDLVVRVYESRGERVSATLALTAHAESVEVTDLLERRLAGAEVTAGNALAVDMRPFQIMTLRFRGVRA